MGLSSEGRRLEASVSGVRSGLEEEIQSRGQGHSQLRVAFDQLEKQLRDLATSLREELGLQEAVLLAAEASIGTLKEALDQEAEARRRADQEVRQEFSQQDTSLR